MDAIGVYSATPPVKVLLSLAGRAWRAIQLSKSLWPPLCPGPRSRVLGPRGVAGTPSVEARSPAERRPLTRLQAGR